MLLRWEKFSTSPGWGGKLNGYLMASCIRNIGTKNYQNLVIGFHVTVENVGDVFGTECKLMHWVLLQMIRVKTKRWRLLRYRVLTTPDVVGSTMSLAPSHAWMPVRTSAYRFLFIVIFLPMLCAHLGRKSFICRNGVRFLIVAFSYFMLLEHTPCYVTTLLM